MNNVVQLTPGINPLTEVQRAFCLIALAGDVRIMDRQEVADIVAGIQQTEATMYQLPSGRLMIKRLLESLPVTSDPKKVVHDFMVSPNTMMYNAVAFSPGATPASTLNYWSDPSIKPVAGDWSVIKAFLHGVICDGNASLFDYLIHFLAHMLQKPEEKPGVIIALLGGQGTGKGSMFSLLDRIWSRTTLRVSDVDHVIGHYNAAIERNYVICMDEALFSGDKKAMDRLKSLVTEPVVTIEQKFQPRRTIASVHRFFAASNHRHFAQVDGDDRRFVFFRVCEGRKGDTSYWESVYSAIEDEAVVAAMVYDLENLDLAAFKVRSRPKTTELMEQKLRSLNGFDRYWFEVLDSGNLNSANDNDHYPADSVSFVATNTLLTGWKALKTESRLFTSIQERDIKLGLLRTCPPANTSRRLLFGRQHRGYNLPPLTEARSEFALFMGGKIDWTG